MADRFIIEGEAFDGDGTSPAAATSNGGVGAWNSITDLEGATPTYGTLSAGDTVYVRSKTAAGADITRTLTASVNLGSTLGTQAQPITWVLDNGTIWPGINGVLTYNCPSTFTVTFRPHNNFISSTPHNIRVVETNSGANQKVTVNFGGNQITDGIFFDASLAATTTNGVRLGVNTGDYRPVTIKNFRAIVGTTFGSLLSLSQGPAVRFVNPDIEFINANELDPIFTNAAGGGYIEVIGGRIHGVGANIAKPVISGSTSGSQVRLIGLQYPQTMRMYASKATPGNSGFALNMTVFGADGGIGSGISEYWGDADSRNDGYYPTLNARIPNSAQSGWSWRIYPQYASRTIPGTLKFAKIYQQDAAQKTVTAELLVADSILDANKSNVYITVSYIDDATGLPKYATSQVGPYNPPALDASIAGWSATTWGATQLVKRKVSVQTPTSIKKDTAVTVTLWVEFSVDSELKILFACPDVLLS